MKLSNAWLVLATAIGSTALLTNAAAAQGIENIGNQGQFVIGAERLTGVFWEKSSIKAEGGDINSSRTAISFLANTPFGVSSGEADPSIPSPANMPRLAFDYFVADSISVGGSLYYLHRSGSVEDGNDLPSESMVFINPRVGYAYQIDETFAIWPKAGFSWAHGSSKPDDGATSKFTLTQLSIEGDVVISPFEHFAIVAGPFVDVGLGGSIEAERNGSSSSVDAKVTSFGLTAGVSAYF